MDVGEYLSKCSNVLSHIIVPFLIWVKGQRAKHMDWKLEGSAQKTEPHVLQEQEVIPEDTGEDGISESFQLLQMDVECELQEEPLPTGSATWCSVSAVGGHGL